MDKNAQPGQKVYNENVPPGQTAFVQPMEGQQSTSSSVLQPGQPGYQAPLQPGQPGYQGLQPGQPGYQEPTSGQSLLSKVTGMLPHSASSTREQTAASLENQPSQSGYQGQLKPGQPGYQAPLQPGQPGYQALQPGQPGYQAQQPGQPGYQAQQPGQPGYQALQPGQPGYQALQPGQPGYQAQLQPGQPGYQGQLKPGEPGYQAALQPGQPGYQALQPGQPGYQAPLQPGQPGYQQPGPGFSSSQPAGQGITQQIGQSVQHALGSSPMPGQSSYVTGQNLPSQQHVPGQMLPGMAPLASAAATSSSSTAGQMLPGQPSYGPPSGFWTGRPTVFPTPNFNANADAERVRNAVKGVSTNDAAIIDLFGTRTSMELKNIDLAYKTMFGTQMLKDVENELKLSGSFGKIVNYRYFSLAEFDSHNIHKSVTGPRTDENALIEILTTRSNQQIRDAGEAYRRMFNRDMEKDVVGDTSGNFRNLMTSLLQANRDESGMVDQNAAIADANLIYNAGQGRWGTDDLTLNNLFATRSFPQLALIFNEYSRVSKYDIEQSIEKEMSGNLKLAMLSIIRVSRDRFAFFAERLYNAMKGIGSDERTINRIIVSRCEIDLEDIKQAYNLKYNKDLSKMVESDSKGDYQRILLQILGNFRPLRA